MSRVRIKICGITSLQLALAACAAGVDAIGLMFYPPSSRHLELDVAEAVARSVTPFVTTVAVMVNPDKAYVEEIIRRTGISMLQFHGEEEDQYCSSFGRPYIKAIRVTGNENLSQIEGNYARAAGVLLDAHLPDQYGGSGRTFDWTLANYGGSKPVILAGGLETTNIAAAIRVASPYGVDISSGVETDGAKDVGKIRGFCDAVRAVA